MIAAGMIMGLGGAILSGGAALAAGLSLPAAFGCYAGGGSLAMLATCLARRPGV